MEKIVFSCGDINGIGPEIILKTINHFKNENLKFFLPIPINVFEEASKIVPINFDFGIFNTLDQLKKSDKKLSILDLGNEVITAGQSTETSGRIAFDSINQSLELINQKIANAIVTAPISKLAFKMANINFPGHTELLGALDKSTNFKMMFLSENMKCMLVTIHEKLSDVPGLIDKDKVSETISTAIDTLKNDLGIAEPKIAVLALNPHAGESGKIGMEEIDSIEPAIREFEDICEGPFVPDAFFGLNLHFKFDLIIGMYHDQVLIPFKLLNFDKGVNYTAGLSIIRTSPDHGTALDIAWKGTAQAISMIESVKWAEKIIRSRKLNGI